MSAQRRWVACREGVRLVTAQASLDDYRRELAENAKHTGTALADATVSSDWRDTWDDAIQRLADAGWDFTVEDVRAIAGPPEAPNASGARMYAAARRGVIVRVGFAPAKRLSLKGHMLSLWRGVR